MKKRILNKLNVLLGMLSFGLAGCHTCRKPVETLYGPPVMAKKYGPPPEVVEKYGVPSELLDEPIDEEPVPEEPTIEEPPVTSEPILKPKYGVPYPN